MWKILIFHPLTIKSPASSLLSTSYWTMNWPEMPDSCSALDGSYDTKAFVGERRSTTASSLVPAIDIKNNCVSICTRVKWKDEPLHGNRSVKKNRRFYQKKKRIFFISCKYEHCRSIRKLRERVNLILFFSFFAVIVTLMANLNHKVCNISTKLFISR